MRKYKMLAFQTKMVSSEVSMQSLCTKQIILILINAVIVLLTCFHWKWHQVLCGFDASWFLSFKVKDVNKNGRGKFSSCFTYVNHECICRGANETESDFNRLFRSKKIVHIVTERTSLASCMYAYEKSRLIINIYRFHHISGLSLRFQAAR